MGHTYPYPRPSLTVDAVIIAQSGAANDRAEILLIHRGKEPFEGCWALPGGFVDENEDLQAAAQRELEEETCIDATGVKMSQLGAFAEPGRDPRGWTVTVAYGAIISAAKKVTGADDAKDAKWFPITALPELAFDHRK
eukprot:scaffold301907_cov48-Prasinocladus_malaysianus.AAC.1